MEYLRMQLTDLPASALVAVTVFSCVSPPCS